MIEADVAAVRNDPVDELELARFERYRAISLVKSLDMLVGKLGDHLVEHIVFMDRDHPEPPAGGAEIFRIGVDSDRVLRQLTEQRAEIVDERSVYVVGQQR